MERLAPTLDETAGLMRAAEEHDPEFPTYLWVAAAVGAARRDAGAAMERGGLRRGVLTTRNTSERVH
jgi:hypothetical protein